MSAQSLARKYIQTNHIQKDLQVGNRGSTHADWKTYNRASSPQKEEPEYILNKVYCIFTFSVQGCFFGNLSRLFRSRLSVSPLAVVPHTCHLSPTSITSLPKDRISTPHQRSAPTFPHAMTNVAKNAVNAAVSYAVLSFSAGSRSKYWRKKIVRTNAKVWL